MQCKHLDIKTLRQCCSLLGRIVYAQHTDVAYCYCRVDMHVFLSVCTSQGGILQNGWTDPDAVWHVGPGNHVLDGVLDPQGKGQFWGG